MKLTELKLSGFRSFQNETIKFDPRLTVFVGKNGSGKTSVLDALHLLLTHYSARVIGSSSSAKRLRETDVRFGADASRLRLLADDGAIGHIRWTIAKQGPRERVLKPSSSELVGLNKFSKAVAARSNGSDYMKGETLPIYYDQSRTVLKIPQRRRVKTDDSALAAFRDSITSSGINFPSLTYWFQDRETDELRRQKRNKDYVDRELDAVRRAITSSTGLKNPYFSVDAPRGLTFEKGSIELHVSQLSSGERVYMALAADLARRLALVSSFGEEALNSSAIVLIDEIELHLHPTWQRQILPWLLQSFPNCQFVVTTHSPQVISGTAAQHVQVLMDGAQGTQVHAADSTLGRDSNYILESVFGAGSRDQDTERMLIEADEAISHRNVSQAQQLIERLSGLIEGSAPEISVLQSRLARRTS